jgi:hypothetical protein
LPGLQQWNGDDRELAPLRRQVLGLVDELEGVLSEDFVKRIRRHAGYFADTEEYGRIDARFDKRGELTPVESETIRTDRNTLRQMESELRRHGADDTGVQAKLEEFARAPEGARMQVTPGFTVTKGIPLAEIGFQRSWDDPVAPPLVPLGIAYLYLALSIGGHVYGQSLEPARRALREAMAGDDGAANAWPIQPMRRNAPPEPKHALAVVEEPDGVVVTIWLFRELVWKVRFAGAALRGLEPFYLLDLISGEETCE